jgi:hypothetical protein
VSDSITSNSNNLVSLFQQFNDVTGKLQVEMSAALVANEANRIDLCQWLKKPEEAMQHQLNKAVFAFVGAMPLASMNGVNLFMEAMLLHVQLTGDPMIEQVVTKINELEQ